MTETNDNPAWLTAKVDQRLATLDDIVLPVIGNMVDENTTLMMFLQDPPADPSDEDLDKWERTCDSCGKDCRGLNFHNGSVGARHTTRHVHVVFAFGVCDDCKF